MRTFRTAPRLGIVERSALGSVLLLSLISAYGLAGLPSASDSRATDEEAKLKLLNDKLGALKRDLDGLDDQKASLLGELHRLDIEIRMGREELELMELQLERGYREIDALLKRTQQLETSIRELRPYLAGRSASLYKLGRLSYVRLLLSVEQPADLTRAYRYISRLARADGEKIRRFLVDQKALEATKADLLERTKEMLETRAELEKTTETLERRRATKQNLLEEIHERREMAETLLFELEQAHEKLEKLLVNLASGDPTQTETVFLPIRLFRGELSWPVIGRVGARFGKHIHPRFRTVTVQNGVEIEAPLNTTVRSVYDGSVVFASWFQGYGKLLIIGHPEGVHSLYGHLADIKVKDGDTIHRGDEVAWVGDTGSLYGPSLYFEIRVNGKPVDPETWLGELPELPARRATEEP